MKKLSKTRIISSTVWIIIYILFIAVAIPCIGNKIVQDMKSEAKIELTSEEMICYDIKDVSIPVGIDEPFKNERRYYIRSTSTENVVLESYYTTTPFKINETFTQYDISVRCRPSNYNLSSAKSLYINFVFYKESQVEPYRAQAVKKVNEYINQDVKKSRTFLFSMGTLVTFVVMFLNFAFDTDICLFGDKITVYVDDEEEDSNENRTE